MYLSACSRSGMVGMLGGISNCCQSRIATSSEEEVPVTWDFSWLAGQNFDKDVNSHWNSMNIQWRWLTLICWLSMVGLLLLQPVISEATQSPSFILVSSSWPLGNWCWLLVSHFSATQRCPCFILVSLSYISCMKGMAGAAMNQNCKLVLNLTSQLIGWAQ